MMFSDFNTEIKERLRTGLKWSMVYGIAFLVIWFVGTKIGISSFPVILPISRVWIKYLLVSLVPIFVLAFSFAPLKVSAQSSFYKQKEK